VPQTITLSKWWKGYQPYLSESEVRGRRKCQAGSGFAARCLLWCSYKT